MRDNWLSNRVFTNYDNIVDGAGKTLEAGLVLREMLLRRRVDYVLVGAPAGPITRQWQDELETKFGLAFTIIDREHVVQVRRDAASAPIPGLPAHYSLSRTRC